MITKILSTAVKLYLRSQVSQAEELQVKIIGKNRQIFSGYIPQVSISCSRGVYQGLHLREVKLKGTDIAFNLSEVIKKQPFKLLEPIVVAVDLCFDAKDLQISLDSDLLQSGLKDLWQNILSPYTNLTASVEWNDIAIADGQLNLSGIYRDGIGAYKKLNLSTAVTLSDRHTLCLFPLTIVDGSQVCNLTEKLEIDLGTDTTIEQLTIKPQQILCSGKITVRS